MSVSSDAPIGGEQFKFSIDARQCGPWLPWEYRGAFPVAGWAFVYKFSVKFLGDVAEACAESGFQIVTLWCAFLPLQKELPFHERPLEEFWQAHLERFVFLTLKSAFVLLLFFGDGACLPLLQCLPYGDSPLHRGAQFWNIGNIGRAPEKRLRFSDTLGKEFLIALVSKWREQPHLQVARFGDRFIVHFHCNLQRTANLTVFIAEVTEHFAHDVHGFLLKFSGSGVIPAYLALQAMFSRCEEAIFSILFGDPAILLKFLQTFFNCLAKLLNIHIHTLDKHRSEVLQRRRVALAQLLEQEECLGDASDWHPVHISEPVNLLHGAHLFRTDCAQVGR